ncbi:MAG: hypothetical protein LBG13_00950 [Holosporales bacterium]|jgi:hypothetical protein|nr:hypothetical protein [Holosporales bacterium]
MKNIFKSKISCTLLGVVVCTIVNGNVHGMMNVNDWQTILELPSIGCWAPCRSASINRCAWYNGSNKQLIVAPSAEWSVWEWPSSGRIGWYHASNKQHHLIIDQLGNSVPCDSFGSSTPSQGGFNQSTQSNQSFVGGCGGMSYTATHTSTSTIAPTITSFGKPNFNTAGGQSASVLTEAMMNGSQHGMPSFPLSGGGGNFTNSSGFQFQNQLNSMQMQMPSPSFTSHGIMNMGGNFVGFQSPNTFNPMPFSPFASQSIMNMGGGGNFVGFQPPNTFNLTNTPMNLNDGEKTSNITKVEHQNIITGSGAVVPIASSTTNTTTVTPGGSSSSSVIPGKQLNPRVLNLNQLIKDNRESPKKPIFHSMLVSMRIANNSGGINISNADVMDLTPDAFRALIWGISDGNRSTATIRRVDELMIRYAQLHPMDVVPREYPLILSYDTTKSISNDKNMLLRKAIITAGTIILESRKSDETKLESARKILKREPNITPGTNTVIPSEGIGGDLESLRVLGDNMVNGFTAGINCTAAVAEYIKLHLLAAIEEVVGGAAINNVKDYEVLALIFADAFVRHLNFGMEIAKSKSSQLEITQALGIGELIRIARLLSIPKNNLKYPGGWDEVKKILKRNLPLGGETILNYLEVDANEDLRVKRIGRNGATLTNRQAGAIMRLIMDAENADEVNKIMGTSIADIDEGIVGTIDPAIWGDTISAPISISHTSNDRPFTMLNRASLASPSENLTLDQEELSPVEYLVSYGAQNKPFAIGNFVRLSKNKKELTINRVGRGAWATINEDQMINMLQVLRDASASTVPIVTGLTLEEAEALLYGTLDISKDDSYIIIDWYNNHNTNTTPFPIGKHVRIEGDKLKIYGFSLGKLRAIMEKTRKAKTPTAIIGVLVLAIANEMIDKGISEEKVNAVARTELENYGITNKDLNSLLREDSNEEVKGEATKLLMRLIRLNLKPVAVAPSIPAPQSAPDTMSKEQEALEVENMKQKIKVVPSEETLQGAGGPRIIADFSKVNSDQSFRVFLESMQTNIEGANKDSQSLAHRLSVTVTDKWLSVTFPPLCSMKTMNEITENLVGICANFLVAAGPVQRGKATLELNKTLQERCAC